MFRFKTVQVALIALIATLCLAASEPTCRVLAQGSECSDGCKAAYGECYKGSHNRSACETQLQRCLQGCIAGKRG